jgi:hypothetical protein
LPPRSSSARDKAVVALPSHAPAQRELGIVLSQRAELTEASSDACCLCFHARLSSGR